MTSQKGLIKLIAISLIGLIILSILGISLSNVFQNQTFQDNWQYIKEKLGNFYYAYLEYYYLQIKEFFKQQLIDKIKQI